MNIDFNQNKGKNKSVKRLSSKDRASKRLSKISFDVSKMRHLFKIRKSYTLNDLEILKRISIEHHEYEEPISPLSLNSQPTGIGSKAEATGGASEYIEPDTKHIRGRSASVPAKLVQQGDGYLKPVAVENGRKKCDCAYVNLQPSSPNRGETNLYDIPEMTRIDEDAEKRSELEAHTYVRILES